MFMVSFLFAMVFVQVFGLAIALLWQSPNGIVSLLWRGVSERARCKAAEGKDEARRSIAVGMKKAGMASDVIARLTGLSVADVEDLQV